MVWPCKIEDNRSSNDYFLSWFLAADARIKYGPIPYMDLVGYSFDCLNDSLQDERSPVRKATDTIDTRRNVSFNWTP